MTSPLAAPHLIFDFDGTLIDSGPAILHTYARVLEAHGLQPAVPLTGELIGPPLPQTLARVVGRQEPLLIAQLTAEFKAHYDAEGLYATTLYPGVAEALHGLFGAGQRLYLATNKRERPTLLLLEHFCLRELFTAVYCLDSRTPAFADKGSMLRQLLADQALGTGNSVYLGDTSHDEAAAAEAGLPFVAVTWGYGVGAQRVSAGARRVADLAELRLR
ncbi:MAG: HAD family hydrolase [Pseudohongiellaceae bacterium]|jgi:phosphoglycolate phosphatase